MPIIIHSRARDGFLRAGRAHPAGRAEYPLHAFSAEALLLLRAEPAFVVTEEPDGTEQRMGAAGYLLAEMAAEIAARQTSVAPANGAVSPALGQGNVLTEAASSADQPATNAGDQAVAGTHAGSDANGAGTVDAAAAAEAEAAAAEAAQRAAASEAAQADVAAEAAKRTKKAR